MMIAAVMTRCFLGYYDGWKRHGKMGNWYSGQESVPSVDVGSTAPDADAGCVRVQEG